MNKIRNIFRVYAKSEDSALYTHIIRYPSLIKMAQMKSFFKSDYLGILGLMLNFLPKEGSPCCYVWDDLLFCQFLPQEIYCFHGLGLQGDLNRAGFVGVCCWHESSDGEGKREEDRENTHFCVSRCALITKPVLEIYDHNWNSWPSSLRACCK